MTIRMFTFTYTSTPVITFIKLCIVLESRHFPLGWRAFHCFHLWRSWTINRQATHESCFKVYGVENSQKLIRNVNQQVLSLVTNFQRGISSFNPTLFEHKENIFIKKILHHSKAFTAAALSTSHNSLSQQPHVFCRNHTRNPSAMINFSNGEA